MKTRTMVCAVVSLFCSSVMAADFNVLMPPAGVSVSSFTVRGLSADGSTVVGDYVTDDRTEAFRWTAATGVVPIGDLPGGEHKSIAYGVSADGSVIVGSGNTVTQEINGDVAMRWTADAGMIALGVQDGSRTSVAIDVSHDGNTVLGTDRFWRPFFWTELEGMVGIDGLTAARAEVNDLSPDGTTVVGRTTDKIAYRWNRIDGLVDITNAPFNEISSYANAISGDNSTVVGRGVDAPIGFAAFRWTEEAGMVSLEPVPDIYERSEATDISFDGEVVVGEATRDGFTEPFIWDEAGGMRSLVAQLLNDGVDVPLNNVSCDCFISADGTIIAGNGNNLGWIAFLEDSPIDPPVDVVGDLTGDGFVDFRDLTLLLANWNGPPAGQQPAGAQGEEAAAPEPSTLVLALVATLGLAGCRRRRKR